MENVKTAEELIAELNAAGFHVPGQDKKFSDPRLGVSPPAYTAALVTYGSAQVESLNRILRRHSTADTYVPLMQKAAAILHQHTEGKAAIEEKFRDPGNRKRETEALKATTREALDALRDREVGGLKRGQKQGEAALDRLVAGLDPEPKDATERLLQHLKQAEARSRIPAPEVVGIRPDGSTITTWDGLFDGASEDMKKAMAAAPPMVVPGDGKPGSLPRFVPAIDGGKVHAWKETRLVGTPEWESVCENLHDLNRLSEAIEGTFNAVDNGLGAKPEGDVVVTGGSGERTLTT